ncbi:MAG: acyl carrier protein [Phycisphaerales bacterium]|nr:MAG: acyl carrier protein [Phycisphaerales bacterium]
MKGFEAARAEILDWVSEATQTPLEQIDLTKPLAEIGIDSLDAVHMISTIEAIIRQELPEDIIQRVSCLSDIFDMMREKIAAA